MGTTAEKLSVLTNTKAGIKAALEEMGRQPNDIFSSYGDEIRGIKTESQINNGRDVSVVARDKIQIGDTVYTVENSGGIFADGGTTELFGTVLTAAFSPDGSTLVLGGIFAGCAKVYSVSGTSITYVSDIYADGGTTYLDGIVTTAAFSPDGSKLVLGGNFNGEARLYSVIGTSITYVRDIYADGRKTALNNGAETAVFSPDGSTLVIGGYFTGCAKFYWVRSTSITFVSDIYADGGSTALLGLVKTAAFSPDGLMLVLGGAFTGKAKVYRRTVPSVAYGRDGYPAPEGLITPVGSGNGVGFATEDILKGQTGTVKVIGTLKI